MLNLHRIRVAIAREMARSSHALPHGTMDVIHVDADVRSHNSNPFPHACAQSTSTGRSTFQSSVHLSFFSFDFFEFILARAFRGATHAEAAQGDDGRLDTAARRCVFEFDRLKCIKVTAALCRGEIRWVRRARTFAYGRRR